MQGKHVTVFLFFSLFLLIDFSHRCGGLVFHCSDVVPSLPQFLPFLKQQSTAGEQSIFRITFSVVRHPGIRSTMSNQKK